MEQQNNAIARPKEVKFRSDGSEIVQLVFSEESKLYPKRSRFFIRGGICFPTFDKVKGTLAGYACVIGYNLVNKKMIVFEEKPFVSLLNISGERGAVEFFNEIYKLYGVRKYYYHQDSETWRRFTIQTSRIKLLEESEPIFIPVDWQDDQFAQIAFFEAAHTEKFFCRKDGDLCKALSSWDMMRGFETMPVEVRALMAGINGIERDREHFIRRVQE